MTSDQAKEDSAAGTPGNPKTAAEIGIGQGSELSPDRRADNQNWTLPPWNRWAFQRVQQFTRTARVARSEQPSALEYDLRDLSGISFEDTAGRACTIADVLSGTYTDGFLVMHRGRVLTEQYFNGMDRSTLHLIMSCSKAVTSTVAGSYIESGALDTSAFLTDYVPELGKTGMVGATLQQALDMQVGVRFNEDYDDLDADWRHCEVATGWREATQDYDGPLGQLAYAMTLTEAEASHGERFHYQSVLTNVIGACLQRATGKSFPELLSEHIWTPIGAEQDFVSIIDADGVVSFEGGFNICLRDFARFGQLIATGGQCQGQQLVPVRWIETCLNPGATLIGQFAASDYAELLPRGAYHNQWWVRDPEQGVMMALGINGQMLYLDSKRDFIVAKMCSQPEAADITMALDTILACEAIVTSLD